MKLEVVFEGSAKNGGDVVVAKKRGNGQLFVKESPSDSFREIGSFALGTDPNGNQWLESTSGVGATVPDFVPTDF